jgi:predicted protein tyrosine phosphatase
MKILFICSKNKVRSVTAEKVYQRVSGLQVRSRGTDASARIRVGEGDIGWAEMILCFERRNFVDLKARFGEEVLEGKEIHILDIRNERNEYSILSAKLVSKIKEAADPYILPDEEDEDSEAEDEEEDEEQV